MRKALSIFLGFILLLAFTPNAEAQMLQGVTPEQDEVMMGMYRRKMDSIRAYRPTVAVVFSGGGAKGFSIIGAMRYIEEKGIPVDLVVGNSIGALMGGAYALGWDSHRLEWLVKNADWEILMSDKSPREYSTFKQSKYSDRYLLSVPFYYSREDFRLKVESDRKFDRKNVDSAPDKFRRPKGPALGAEGKEDSEGGSVRENLLGSLPSGFMYGQNVNNLISSITVGYQDSTVFCNLPIPFACLATDLVSEKPKYWFCGNLNQALRSSMSVPGVFAPIRKDGMMLVDGAMRDNYPTDVAKALGADIVIGIDVSAPPLTYSQMNNLMDIFSQGVDMLGREVYERNIKIPDVSINPDLTGYGLMSFSSENADTLIRRGYVAAEKADSLLEAVKGKVGTVKNVASPKALSHDLWKDGVLVDDIVVEGVGRKDAEFLLNKLSDLKGKRISKGDADDAISQIYAMKAFDYVTYEFSGNGEPYTLKVNCKKGPIHRFGLGARFDTEEIASVLLNLGINCYAIQGSSLDIEGKIGTNPYASTTYSYTMQKGPTLNLQARYKYVDRNKFSLGEDKLNLTYHSLRFDAFASNIRFRNVDVKVGGRSEYFDITSVLSDFDMSGYDSSMSRNNYFSAFASGKIDTFDHGLFPTRGVQAGVDWQWVLADTKSTSPSLQIFAASFRAALPVGGIATVLPRFDGRVVFGDNIPAPYVNMIGGAMEGRYLDQQIAHRGINNAKLMMSKLFTAGVDLRFKVARNNYVTAFADAGDSANELGNLFSSEDSYSFAGFGVEYSYNSIAGPLRFNLHWSTLTKKVGAYLSFGFDF